MSIDSILRKMEDGSAELLLKGVGALLPRVLKHGGFGVAQALTMYYGPTVFGYDISAECRQNWTYPIAGVTGVAAAARAYEESRKDRADRKPFTGAVKTGIYTALVNTATMFGTLYLLNRLGNSR